MVVWFRFCFIYKIFFCKPCLNFAILVADFTLFGKVFRNPTFDGKQVIITQGVIMWDCRALFNHIIQIFEWIIIKYHYLYMSVTCVFLICHLMWTLILYKKLYLEDVRLNPVMMRPASIFTLSNKLFSPCVQFYHLTSLYSKIGHRVG